ncbi:MAG: ABC transporter permease, partial [Firmicutes bacterium]|nr:ABC transporter permease [Bacillota bacterium]
MQVFKTYFKVIRASAGLIFMYLAIFISIAVMISVMSPSSGSVEF